MIWNLPTDSLIMVIVLVAMPAFLFALVLDSVMKGDGFGPIGNTIVLTGGFFLGILAFNHHGVRFEDATYASEIGLLGAFASMVALAVMKASLQRFLSR